MGEAPEIVMKRLLNLMLRMRTGARNGVDKKYCSEGNINQVVVLELGQPVIVPTEEKKAVVLDVVVLEVDEAVGVVPIVLFPILQPAPVECLQQVIRL